jgi:hypothetical protein
VANNTFKKLRQTYKKVVETFKQAKSEIKKTHPEFELFVKLNEKEFQKLLEDPSSIKDLSGFVTENKIS